MADKTYIALEKIKQDCAELVEDSAEATEVIKEKFEILKPYLWYFSVIFSNYCKANPDLMGTIESLYFGITSLDDKNGTPTYEQRLMKSIMHISYFDRRCGKLRRTTNKLEIQTADINEKITTKKLDYKELKKIKTELEDAYSYLERGEDFLINSSQKIIDLMKALQNDFPNEYAKYIIEA